MRIRRLTAHPLRELLAVHVRHVHVGNDDVTGVGGQPVQSQLGAFKGHRSHAPAGKLFAQNTQI